MPNVFPDSNSVSPSSGFSLCFALWKQTDDDSKSSVRSKSRYQDT